MTYLDNFPIQYTPRETQKNVINDIETAVKSGYKNILLCVPTGVGKSHIAVTIAKSLGTSFIITAQKILQDQYTNDFAFIHSMKGKSNFPCIDMYDISKIPYDTAKNDHTISCNMGNCSWEENIDGKKKTIYCKHKPKLESFSKRDMGTENERIMEPDEQKCFYYNQKFQALLSTHALFNYSSYFQTRLYPQGIEELLLRDSIIADEAHEIEDQIISYIGYDIRPKILEDVKMSLEDYVTDTTDGVLELLEILGDEYTRETRRLENVEDVRTQSYRKKRDKIDSIRYEIKDNFDNFVIQENKDISGGVTSISIKPINIGKYTKQFFDRPTQIFMSATINKMMFCRTMSIPEEQCAFIEVEKSPFPVNHRTINFHNIRKLNYHSTTDDYTAVFAKVKEILKFYRTEKGLILTTTKKHCSEIAEKMGDRITIAHEGVEGKREMVLDNHKNTKKPNVLVSPSLWYGVDLKDDLSRFQIILKAPYPSMADKRTRVKSERDPLWYQNKAVEKLLQGFGRSIRNDNDYAETHVIDESCYILLSKMKRFVPKAYWDSLGWDE